MLGKCDHCINGQTIIEVTNESCNRCMRSGASVCGNCLRHFEEKCLQCGRVKQEFTKKRREIPE